MLCYIAVTFTRSSSNGLFLGCLLEKGFHSSCVSWPNVFGLQLCRTSCWSGLCDSHQCERRGPHSSTGMAMHGMSIAREREAVLLGFGSLTESNLARAMSVFENVVCVLKTSAKKLSVWV